VSRRQLETATAAPGSLHSGRWRNLVAWICERSRNTPRTGRCVFVSEVPDAERDIAQWIAVYGGLPMLEEKREASW
jgi:hypothetical protein